MFLVRLQKNLENLLFSENFVIGQSQCPDLSVYTVKAFCGGVYMRKLAQA